MLYKNNVFNNSKFDSLQDLFTTITNCSKWTNIFLENVLEDIPKVSVLGVLFS